MPVKHGNYRPTVTLPQDEYDRLMAWLQRRSMSFSEFTRKAIQTYAEDQGLVLDLTVKVGGDRTQRGS